MNCTEIQNELVLFILAELPASKMNEIEAHIQQCPACETRLRETSESVDSLYDLAPTPPVDDQRHENLIANVMERCQTPSPTVPPRPAHLPMQPKGLWLAALAAGFTLAAFLGYVRSNLEFGSSPILAGKKPAVDVSSAPSVALGEGWREQLRSSPFSDSPRSTTLFVSTHVNHLESNGRMFVLVDELSKQLHVFGSGFDAAPVGQSYSVSVRIAEQTESVIVGDVDVGTDGRFEAILDAPVGTVLETFLRLDATGSSNEKP